MAFPDDELELEVGFAFGADLTADPQTWQFTDLSERLLATPISIRRGVAVGSSTTQTSFATVQLLNDDGALTPLLASSPYWPYVDAGTPARLRLRNDTSPLYADTFSRVTAPGFGLSDSGHTYSYTSGGGVNFTSTGTQGKVSVPGTNLLRRASSFFSIRDVDLYFDVSTAVVSATAANIIGAHLRYQDSGNYLWPTVEFTTAGTMAIRVWAYVAGAPTSLVSVPSTGVSYTPGEAIRCRVLAEGDRLRMRIWPAADPEPGTWHVDLQQELFLDAGRVGFQAWVQASNTNTLPVDMFLDNVAAYQVRRPRLEGYIADVRPVFVPLPDGETHSVVQVDIAGVGSRLEKQQSPAWSPLRRSIQLADIAPVAYWPLEDPEGSRTGASAFAGHQAMTVTGPAVFGFASGIPTEQYLSRYGTKPMVSVAAGARLSAQVPATSTTNRWSVSLTNQMYVPDVPGVSEVRIMEWLTPAGTFQRWALVGTNTGYQVRAYNDAAGTSTNVATFSSAVYTVQVNFEVEAVQNGGNIDVNLQVDSSSIATGSVAGTVGGTPVRVTVNPDQANTTASVTPNGLRFIAGHVRVFDNVLASGVPFYYDDERGGWLVRGDKAWYTETAHRRVARLCREERVPVTILGDPTATGTTVLNAQQDGTFTELVEAAAESESGGLLYEAGFGYRYLPRTARYNAPVALTVDMAAYAHSGDAADVLVPQLDARAPTAWTVQRADGSSGSWEAPAEYRQRRGTVREEVTVDVLRDEDLPAHAAWRGHLGVDATDARYPSLQIDLAANPDLIDAWLECDVGSRVQRTNQPTIAGHNVIDQVVDGYTETLSPRGWLVSANCSPAGVWDVFTLDDPVLGWISPDGSTLNAGVDGDDTAVVIAGPYPWTTAAVYPVDVNIAGERVTLTAPPAGGTSPQTFTGVLRGVNGFTKPHAAGSPVTLWTVPVLGL